MVHFDCDEKLKRKCDYYFNTTITILTVKPPNRVYVYTLVQHYEFYKLYISWKMYIVSRFVSYSIRSVLLTIRRHTTPGADLDIKHVFQTMS